MIVSPISSRCVGHKYVPQQESQCGHQENYPKILRSQKGKPSAVAGVADFAR